MTYNSNGSTAGYDAIAGGTSDFGASDAPLSNYSSPTCNTCVQIPWALTATGISFNIDNGKIKSLHLTGPVLANIYLGHITNWDNSAIKHLNPHTNLPNLPIQVFFRNSGSGDSYAFSCYLSDVSSEFKTKEGCSTSPNFSAGVGTGASGNSGMASAVQQHNGAIAYVAVSYLANDGLPAAGIKNRAGNFEFPNLNSIEAAAAVVHQVPSNNQVTILNPPRTAKSAYVMSTFTYVIVPTSGGSRFNSVPGSVIKQFIYYAITQGQQFGARQDFAHLPSNVLAADKSTLKTVSNN